jgi:hypothetical protein
MKSGIHQLCYRLWYWPPEFHRFDYPFANSERARPIIG